MGSKFFIIFPSGNRSQLSVLELSEAMYYERHDYAMASRHEFNDELSAREYAMNLAIEHDKEFIGDNNEGYLD